MSGCDELGTNYVGCWRDKSDRIGQVGKRKVGSRQVGGKASPAQRIGWYGRRFDRRGCRVGSMLCTYTYILPEGHPDSEQPSMTTPNNSHALTSRRCEVEKSAPTLHVFDRVPTASPDRFLRNGHLLCSDTCSSSQPHDAFLIVPPIFTYSSISSSTPMPRSFESGERDAKTTPSSR